MGMVYDETKIMDWYCMSGSLSVDVLSNENHTNDNNNTAPSTSLLFDAVTAAVAMPWVRRVYCYQYCMLDATNYVLSDENDRNDQHDQ